MLGKLLKYELKSNVRTFLPLYGAILIVVLVVRFSIAAQISGLVATTASLVLFALFVALGVMTIIMIVQRFSKNLLSNEGYLMFTLPVSCTNLILSKLISAVIWTFFSGIVAILTFLLLAFDADLIFYFRMTFGNFGKFLDTLQAKEYLMVAEFLFSCLFIYVSFVMSVYASLAAGQISIFHKHRSLVSLAAFVVLLIVDFNLSSALMSLIPTTAVSYLTFAAVYSAVSSVALFILTEYLLRRHLNLE